MRRRNIKGEIIEDSEQAKTKVIKLRVSDTEYEQVQVIMEKYGYRTVSSFLRDLVFKKKLISKQVVVRVTDNLLKEKLNQFIFQANKIGVNYNQFVATYQRQSKMTGPDGKLILSNRMVDEKVDSLMKLTEQMRDEIAVIIDIFERYTQEN